MGGALVYRERVRLQDLEGLVFKEQREALKLNLYLRSVYCKPCKDSAIIFNVTIEFSK